MRRGRTRSPLLNLSGSLAKAEPPTTSPESPMTEQPEHILQFFAYEHLPAHLQAVSKPFGDLARAIVHGGSTPDTGAGILQVSIPRNPERTVALRKLLEAKDAAVRAMLAKP